MEKANSMMNDDNCWYALHTAPRLERNLLRQLNAAGYATYSPMQTIYVKWNGVTKEVIIPLFPGCVFVKGDSEAIHTTISSQKAAFLVDGNGNNLSFAVDKMVLTDCFSQLLKG